MIDRAVAIGETHRFNQPVLDRLKGQNAHETARPVVALKKVIDIISENEKVHFPVVFSAFFAGVFAENSRRDYIFLLLQPRFDEHYVKARLESVKVVETAEFVV